MGCSEGSGWATLTTLGASQYGLVTTRQVGAAMTRRQFDHLARSGGLEPVANGVWRLPGAPRIWRARVMAACLSVGPPVAASHTSAARLWDIEDVAPDGVHLTVPRHRSGRIGPVGQPPAEITVHHGDLPPAVVTERHRLPVTGLARTLVDLAGVVPVDLLGPIADDLARRRLLDVGELSQERRHRRPVAGGHVVDALVARWRGDAGQPAGDSRWEDEVHRWLVEAGLPAPCRQHEVALGNGRLALVDLAYPVEQVAVEFDGYRYHDGRQRFDRDRERVSELAADGWLPILVTSNQTSADVVDRVRRALERRGWDPTGPVAGP